MTEKHNCPICKGDVSKEAKDHVLNEMEKLRIDPDYELKTYEGDREEDTDE